MAPLLILIIAEWIWGMKVGLWLAIAYGVGELAYFAIRYKRFEKSTLADVGLLVLLGIVAIALDGEVLDRIRPLIYMLILLLMLGISVFSKHNLLMAASGRMLKGRTFSPWEMQQMQNVMKTTFWWMSGYFVVLLIGILFLSEESQQFLNSTGLYIFIAVAFLFLMIQKRFQNQRWQKEEWLPLIQEDGKVIGAAPRSVVHNGKSKWLHPVVHLQVLRGDGLWLQKRPMNKLVQPGKWDTAVGGHLSANEPIEVALQRETWEEIGVQLAQMKVEMLGRYQWKSKLEHEMVFAFVLIHEGTITPHPEELVGGRVWSFKEIEEALGKEIFTPNFEYEYNLYKNSLKSKLGVS